MMLKKILLTMIAGAGAIALMIVAVYESTFSEKYLLDATFIVGMFMFAIGLMMTTNASKLFQGFGFLVKKLIGRKFKDVSYFDYVQNQKAPKEKVTGLPFLLVGFAITVGAIIWAFIYMN